MICRRTGRLDFGSDYNEDLDYANSENAVQTPDALKNM